MMSGIGGTIVTGMALGAGSEVGHQAVRSLMGGGGGNAASQHQQDAPQQQQQQQQMAPAQYGQQEYGQGEQTY